MTNKIEQKLIEEHNKKVCFYREQKEVYENLCTKEPDNGKHYHYLARAKAELADLLDDKVEHVEIEKLRNTATEDLQKALRKEPSNYHEMWNHHLLARVKNDLAVAAEDSERKKQLLDEALGHVEDAMKMESHELHEHAKHWNHHLKASIFRNLKAYDCAEEHINKAKRVDALEYETHQLEKAIRLDKSLDSENSK